MPSHWTYEEKRPDGDLFQGDIIERTKPLLDVLGLVHSYFCDEKYLGFIVLSQTCDLVTRGSECKAKYINLAVIRTLESMMPTFLRDMCGTVIPGVYYEDGRADVKELIERIINQNEQALGLFYLEPDGDLKIPVESLALLRVSIALRSHEHYGVIKESRLGRLATPFRNKLGWMTGNLYSRVDTPDWPESIGKSKADKKVKKLLKDLDEAARNLWVPRSLFDLTLSKEADLPTFERDKILPAIQAYAPKPPVEAALARLQEVAPPMLEMIGKDELSECGELLKADRAYPYLVAQAILAAVRDHLDKHMLFDLGTRLEGDDRVRDNAAEWNARLAGDFLTARAPKDYPTFLAVFASRPIVDGNLQATVREHAIASAIPDERIDALMTVIQAVTPSPPMQDCMRILLQAATAQNLGNRLAKQLRSDPVFRGAITGS